jgi:hypothetical protein
MGMIGLMLANLISKIKAIPSWLWVLLAFLLALVFIQIYINSKVDEGKKIGANEQQIENLQELNKRVSKAHDIKAQFNNPDNKLLYDECLQSASTPENCKRFMPN